MPSEFSQNLAMRISRQLRQTYELVDGKWWLFTLGKPAKELTDDEVAWHVARKHLPFVPGGIKTDHPDWWKDPSQP